MNSDLFPKESQAEFKALAEILKIKSQIKTLESFETQEVTEEKFNLTESGEKEAILNPVCQKDERLTLKPQAAWLFNVSRNNPGSYFSNSISTSTLLARFELEWVE